MPLKVEAIYLPLDAVLLARLRPRLPRITPAHMPPRIPSRGGRSGAIPARPAISRM